LNLTGLQQIDPKVTDLVIFAKREVTQIRLNIDVIDAVFMPVGNANHSIHSYVNGI
jgi:hypothetical protein